MRAMLRGALTARLFSEAGWQAYPEHAQVRIDRPLFVTGLPRTGTTALHRLLAADPAHQGLELWLAEAPQPRPPRATWADNPVFQYIQAGCERHHVEHPEFMGVHYMAADQVEECWQLLRQSMRSVSWECLAHLPSYSAWLRGQDWTGAYRRHRRNLQLIGLRTTDRRWVLKNPSHLFALDALLAGLPGRADRPDAPRARRRDRVGLQPGGAGVGGLVGHVHRRGHRPGPAGAVGVRAGAVQRRTGPARPGPVLRRALRRPGGRPGRHGGGGLRALRPAVQRRRGGRHAGPGRARVTARSAHRYTLADFGLTAADVGARFPERAAELR